MTRIVALTDLSVRSAKAGSILQKLSDGRGLQLHITPTGSKRWRWAYRFDGKQKLMALRDYPDISLAEARQMTDEARKLLAAGTDPIAQHKVEKINRQHAADNTFKTVAAAWWENWKTARSERHADYVLRRLRAVNVSWLVQRFRYGLL